MSVSHDEIEGHVEELVEEENFASISVSDGETEGQVEELDDEEIFEAVNLGDDKEQEEENNGEMHPNDDNDINANNEKDDGESPMDFDTTMMKRILQSANINKDPRDLLDEDIVGLEFNSIEEAGTFYRIYSKTYGFSVRKNEVKKDKSGIIKVRSWCCSNAGYRQKKYIEAPNRVREPRSESRSGCKAMFRIGYNNSTKLWVVKKFRVHHNHNLANDFESVFLRSHRNISAADLEQAKLMKQAGMTTAEVWNLFVHQKGGWDKVGWTKKDLYNALALDSRGLDDVDATTTLTFLQAKEGIDPDFFYAYKVDEDSILTHLFWADGASRFDYELFGDSLAFDSTYKTNRCQMPLVVLVGSNNHAMTCVFGFALIHNETAETYSWVLQKFQECMKGKLPETIITDGCKAMNKAIEDLMPKVVHRICSWHILNNSAKHVHRDGFARELRNLIKRYYSVEEFENRWQQMLRDYNAENNDWAKALYSTRHQWADTFLRGNFFGGSTATNRCESMNAFLKRFLNEKLPLWKALQHCDHGLAALRYGQMSKHVIDKLSTPVVKQTTMAVIEEQFSAIYTKKMFIEVRNEIIRSDKYSVVQLHIIRDAEVCTIQKYLSTNYPNRKVTFSRIDNNINCDCLWMETKGIPCRHIFSAMKRLQLSDIPKNLVKNRWLKDCKESYLSGPGAESRFIHPDRTESRRYGGINEQVNLFTYYCKKSSKIQEKGTELMSAVLIELKKMVTDIGEEEKVVADAVREVNEAIKEPNPIATKGRPSQGKSSQNHESQPIPKPRICRVCRKSGHDFRNCKVRKRANEKEPMESNELSDTSLI